MVQDAQAPVAASPADAVRAVARLYRQLERAAGELTMAQYRVLAAVASGDHQASRMATKLALGKPAVSASVDALCRRALMTREPGPSDQRAVVLRVTAEGRRVLLRVEAATTAKLGEIIDAAEGGADVVPVLAALGVAMEAIDVAGPERARART
jgi:DNA-binding MarR family transcriptional regulator